jgi:hypothetical protein
MQNNEHLGTNGKGNTFYDFFDSEQVYEELDEPIY